MFSWNEIWFRGWHRLVLSFNTKFCSLLCTHIFSLFQRQLLQTTDMRHTEVNYQHCSSSSDEEMVVVSQSQVHTVLARFHVLQSGLNSVLPTEYNIKFRWTFDSGTNPQGSQGVDVGIWGCLTKNANLPSVVSLLKPRCTRQSWCRCVENVRVVVRWQQYDVSIHTSLWFWVTLMSAKRSWNIKTHPTVQLSATRIIGCWEGMQRGRNESVVVNGRHHCEVCHCVSRHLIVGSECQCNWRACNQTHRYARRLFWINETTETRWRRRHWWHWRRHTIPRSG